VREEPYLPGKQLQEATVTPSARTSNYLKQIKGGFAFKALGALASFAAVPLMLRYLGAERYGIWSTVMSITAWVMLSDMGIGYGLRNKVTEALARNDIADAGAYVSSAYTALGMLSLAAFALFLPASAHIAWQRLFNTTGVDAATLRSFALLTIFFILASMWSGLVNQVLNALQRSSAVVFGQMVFNALCLVFVFVLLHTARPSLVLMATAYGMALLASHAALSIWCYRQRLALAPRASVDRPRLAALMRLGLQFFALELGYVVTVATDKILITQMFGPQSVAQYDVLFKLFSVVTVAHGLITMPLWSSYANAYHQDDHAWIHATLRGQRLVFVAFAVARPVLAWWVGAAIPVSTGLVAGMAAFIAIFTWNNIHSTALNSIGITGPQLRLSLLAMMVNVPLSIAAVRAGGFGAEAIPLASAISLLPFALRCHFHLRAALRASA
jgi:O-antigen/teichoic acid export membrane protein